MPVTSHKLLCDEVAGHILVIIICGVGHRLAPETYYKLAI
jgi:hypothetical protein